jgi:hypothetical protein
VSIALPLRASVRSGSRLHLLVLLPAVTMAADYLENIGIRVLLAAYPDQPPVVPVLSAVTATKLAVGWACSLVLLALLCTAGLRRLRGSRSASPAEQGS